MNHYEVLGVSEKATTEEIKRVYRKLVKHYHPDRNPHDSQAEKKFILISNAYEVLKNETSRKTYDQQLTETSREKKTAEKKAPKSQAQWQGHRDFESFFGFTREGHHLKKQAKPQASATQNDWLESFFKR